MKKPHVIAFYLPQFYPIKENNEWFHEGFTEWTNVGKAKPLFKGHEQPKVPADLGYYDLRVSEVREKQADLAKEAGIDAFCYYHYWFGNGRQIMEYPLQEVVRSHKPNFPFCICWANHSFYKKNWNADTGILDQTLLLEQTYPGDDDIEKHFKTLLHVFQDKRYYQIGGKLVFVIYDIKSIPNFSLFKKRWNDYAIANEIPPFYFIAYSSDINDIQLDIFKECDGTILSLINYAAIGASSSKYKQKWRWIKEKVGLLMNRPLLALPYEDVYPFLTNEVERQDNNIPLLVPNWDLSPRRGAGGTIFYNSTPDKFKAHIKNGLDLISAKDDDKKIIFIKSWNEWGEGNYMEPDIKYGKGYINALKEELATFLNK